MCECGGRLEVSFSELGQICIDGRPCREAVCAQLYAFAHVWARSPRVSGSLVFFETCQLNKFPVLVSAGEEKLEGGIEG